MSRLPLQIGPLHFIGIGGIGMSGVAEVMHNLGYKIQGSDAAETPTSSGCAGLGLRSPSGMRASIWAMLRSLSIHRQ